MRKIIKFSFKARNQSWVAGAQSNFRVYCSSSSKESTGTNIYSVKPFELGNLSWSRWSCFQKKLWRNFGKSTVCLDSPDTKGTLGSNRSTTVKVMPKKKEGVSLSESPTERKFISPIRAMSDYLLKPSDLDNLRRTRRRSPYENEPPITVYWRKDVETKALEVWGSRAALERELKKRDRELDAYRQYIFSVKKTLRQMRKEESRESSKPRSGLPEDSGRVVVTAIVINSLNFVFKLGAWLYSGSHSMFSECLHSLADTVNQLILAFGIYKSSQSANIAHPYGYSNMRYVTSLISGVGIFCVGAGLSVYHGITGLYNPEPIESLNLALMILCGSFVSEGGTLLVAYNSVKKGAAKSGMTLLNYIRRGSDPTVNVVLLEDLAAVLGVSIAAGCMALSTYLNSPIPDALGSVLIGGLLGGVASFIIYTNTAALVGRSIVQTAIDDMNQSIESDVMVRAVHDVKGIDMGSGLVRYKAEVDFDGRELTRSYLEKQDLELLLEEVHRLKTIDEFEFFMLKHGENIVDTLGAEIDRIEKELKVG
ncbi:proton-coupled zinc antiporter SLC30A9, mitochondrial-like isoform X2 [Artemia franciscana]|uniref:proton-coupled zinc antiporter SLC30A9, mitochondrial-like isoform X2 n=1 Tax=Artemia franciscana TaxID=6661 RepID=UPI0032DAA142